MYQWISAGCRLPGEPHANERLPSRLGGILVPLPFFGGAGFTAQYQSQAFVKSVGVATVVENVLCGCCGRTVSAHNGYGTEYWAGLEHGPHRAQGGFPTIERQDTNVSISLVYAALVLVEMN